RSSLAVAASSRRGSSSRQWVRIESSTPRRTCSFDGKWWSTACFVMPTASAMSCSGVASNPLAANSRVASAITCSRTDSFLAADLATIWSAPAYQMVRRPSTTDYTSELGDFASVAPGSVEVRAVTHAVGLHDRDVRRQMRAEVIERRARKDALRAAPDDRDRH